MKASSTQEEYMIAYITEQLNKLGYFDTEGKSLFSLTSTLARIRAANS